MNNEEKILSMLEALIKGQAKLEAGQAEMRADITDLKAGQAKLEAKTDVLSQDLQDTKHILVRLESTNKLEHGGIFDKLDDLHTKAVLSIEQHEKHDGLFEDHDLRLIRLENRD